MPGASSRRGGSMPIMRMYPPSGIHFTPYSVSPRCRDHMVGPKPTMYCGTRTPNSFANDRWPSSCRAMEARSPKKKTTMPTTNSKLIQRSTSVVPGAKGEPATEAPVAQAYAVNPNSCQEAAQQRSGAIEMLGHGASRGVRVTGQDGVDDRGVLYGRVLDVAPQHRD